MATVKMIIRDDLLPHVYIDSSTPILDPVRPNHPSLYRPTNQSNPTLVDSIKWENQLTKAVTVVMPWAGQVFQGGAANKEIPLGPGQTSTTLKVKQSAAGNKSHRYLIYVEPDGPYVIAASDPEVDIK